jgi:esterase/lipase superfamily enzyme
METTYIKQYSPALNRDMECKIYGHAGQPVLFIPCQNGRFFDFENFKMADVWSPWIESGQVMVFAIDTMDQETWSDPYGDARWRSCRYEDWIHYITEEMVPYMKQVYSERNGGAECPGIIPFGCSLGATHAVNVFLRRPDLCTGMLALSGIYTAEYGFGSYMDDLVYMNSPVHYMANLPEDHPYIQMYNERKGIICVGQGDWEVPETTCRLRDIFAQKGIDIWVDLWGYDCAHDWNWWYKQVEYFVPFLLEG